MTADSPTATVAISGHLDTRTAAMEVADRLYDALDGDCHLLMVFASFHHRAAFPDAIEHLRRTLAPGSTLGVTAESVIGESEEREGRAGLSALAMRVPGADFRTWAVGPPAIPGRDELRGVTGIDENSRLMVMVADPFTTPMPAVLDALVTAGDPPGIPVVGGLASGASQPGHNLIAADDQILPAGAAGVTIGGAIEVDCVVSQGCRPIGETLVVTAAENNVIQQLSGQLPMAVLKGIAEGLEEHERQLLNRGLLVGVVIDEYKERFGRGDFLVRNVVGIDTKNGLIAVGDRVKVGQTVQFHVRDATTADEDLQLLLDAQQLGADPLAALLFTCNSRGTRLFEGPNHDLDALHTRLGQLPVAGFFASGEIGPVSSRSFVHGHTASMVVMRKS